MREDPVDGTESAPGVRSKHKSVTAAVGTVAEGTGASLDFFSSVIAGLLLGLFIDWLADTAPLVTIIGIILGFVVGFYKLWVASAVLEEQAKRRRHDG